MKEIIHVKGMHCRSCEVLIEDKVKGVFGVRKVFTNFKKGIAIIYGEGYDRNEIVNAIGEAGYQVGKEDLPLINLSSKDMRDMGIAAALLIVLYFLGRSFGIDRWFLATTATGTSLAAVFTIGVTAGLSTCMALVGGLVLGISTRHAEKHPDATTIQKFRPHLFFNLGRIASYFVLGGLIGQIGSVFRLSGGLLGTLTIAVGILMFFLGIQLLEIFPRFSFKLTLPKGIARFLGVAGRKEAEYSHRNSALLGALTFFLPCGFTQAMQIYAMSSGNFVSGALIMGVFSIGTTPGLLGIGGLTSVIRKGQFGRFSFRFVGVLVIALSVYNISNGLNLTGIKNYVSSLGQSQENPSVGNTLGPTLTGGAQVFKANYDPSDYRSTIKPNEFSVKIGKPVRLEILAKEDGQGCMGSVMIPGLVNRPEFFIKGETAVLEFTPQKIGSYQITCAMGVPSGKIEVLN